MCGICGQLSFDGRPPAEATLEAMMDALRHRGPDGSGLYRDGGLALGHRRLAIIDTGPDGQQPMSNEDGSLWITYNGEIYNFAEIRSDLVSRGHRFRSHTDTEVILHAYETWGVECLSRFNGMFAFALWDARVRRLWLVRDRLGIKPLFYLHRPDRFLFASEIKSILCDPSVDRQIDLSALHHFLSLNYTPAPFTLFSGIRQLLPGSYLLVDAEGQCREETYWNLSYGTSDERDEAWWIDAFEARLSRTIASQMVSDVPLGAFLSGGVDSSGIVYWMSQHASEPVRTFSIGFQEKGYNELEHARQVAALCGTDHCERIVTPDAVEILPRLVWHAEEPTADSSMLPVYYLAAMTREHVKVALSGDGADEILAGYETYQAFYAARLYRRIPRAIRRALLAPMVQRLPVSYGKVSLEFKLKRFVIGAELDDISAHAFWRMIFDEEAKRQLYSPEVRQSLDGSDTVDLYRAAFLESDAIHPLDRMLFVDTRFYLPNDMLVKLDRMTMAHSLEARVPYLDHELVEFIATLPPDLKLKGFRHKKYLLKAVMHRRLPGASLWRKKEGFNIPKGLWFLDKLGDFAYDHLSPEVIRRMGIFQPAELTRLLNEHHARKHDYSHQIWGLLCLSLWWQQFIERPSSSADIQT